MSIEREISPQIYLTFKNRVLSDLVQELDEKFIEKTDPATLRLKVEALVEQKIHDEKLPFSRAVRLSLITDIADELLGYGPLEPALRDQTITEIMVNGPQTVYVERNGKIERAPIRFRDDAHLRQVIDRIVTPLGRRIDESSPMVDARLPDGSRVNAVVPPVSVDGPALSIRRFAVDPLEMDDLLTLKTVIPEIGNLFKGVVRSRLNVLISGGTGSGKTTLLNVLSRFIPPNERIVTIEDSAELQMKQEHVVRLETRPSNIEGKGEITQRDLVRNSLRMRPDRIIVGEVRSAEVLDMLQAMNTGHDGSLTTIHANSPRDALLRLETLVAMTGLNIPNEAVRRYISSAIHVIIHISRLVDGSRKIVSFQEITGMEGNTVTMQEICAFEQTGLDENGRVKGRFVMRGFLPKFMERFAALGEPIPYNIFDSNKTFEV